MRNAHLLTIAICMIACTHLQSNTTICPEDSTQQPARFSPITPVLPVGSPKKTSVTTLAPELPLFKDVLNSKGLFW